MLLDNPLCHAILKPLLSKLQDLVHDSSEKNRIAMMDMLLKVKGIRAIKVCNSVLRWRYCLSMFFRLLYSNRYQGLGWLNELGS